MLYIITATSNAIIPSANIPRESRFEELEGVGVAAVLVAVPVAELEEGNACPVRLEFPQSEGAPFFSKHNCVLPSRATSMLQ